MFLCNGFSATWLTGQTQQVFIAHAEQHICGTCVIESSKWELGEAWSMRRQQVMCECVRNAEFVGMKLCSHETYPS